MSKYSPEAVEFARETVARYAPKGTRVTAIVTHVSSSGMTRRIRFFVPARHNDGSLFISELTHAFATVLGSPVKEDGNGYGLSVHGAGMDMRFHVISHVSRVIHGDDYAISLDN